MRYGTSALDGSRRRHLDSGPLGSQECDSTGYQLHTGYSRSTFVDHNIGHTHKLLREQRIGIVNHYFTPVEEDYAMLPLRPSRTNKMRRWVGAVGVAVCIMAACSEVSAPNPGVTVEPSRAESFQSDPGVVTHDEAANGSAT